MANRTLVMSQDPVGQQTLELITSVYDRCKLSLPKAKRLMERAEELQAEFTNLLVKLATPVSEEGVNISYPPEYKGPRPIQEQIKTLAKILGLNPKSSLEFAEKLPKLPEGAEGWFAVPSMEALARKYFPGVKTAGEVYGKSVSLINKKISERRLFSDFVDHGMLSVCVETARKWEHLSAWQPNQDILIVGAQLGERYRGLGSCKARQALRGRDREFGLGGVAVGSIVLTHPERLVRKRELHMECIGDDIDPYGMTPCVTTYHQYGQGVRFGTHRVGTKLEHFGAVTGFLP